MDETGFAVGTTQSTRIIVNLTQKSSWKVTPGKQEWVTAIEFIDVSGGALSLMVIFKAQDAPSNWQFSTSASHITANMIGFCIENKY